MQNSTINTVDCGYVHDPAKLRPEPPVEVDCGMASPQNPTMADEGIPRARASEPTARQPGKK